MPWPCYSSNAGSVFDLHEKFWWFDEALPGYFSFAATLVPYAYDVLLAGCRRHELLLVLILRTLREMIE